MAMASKNFAKGEPPVKIQILKDSKGEITATFEPTTETTISVRPEITNDQMLEEVEMPEDYKFEVDLLYQKYRQPQKIHRTPESKKIQSLKDSKGEIIATFESTPEASVSVRPEITNDQILEEVETPEV